MTRGGGIELRRGEAVLEEKWDEPEMEEGRALSGCVTWVLDQQRLPANGNDEA